MLEKITKLLHKSEINHQNFNIMDWNRTIP